MFPGDFIFCRNNVAVFYCPQSVACDNILDMLEEKLFGWWNGVLDTLEENSLGREGGEEERWRGRERDGERQRKDPGERTKL